MHTKSHVQHDYPYGKKKINVENRILKSRNCERVKGFHTFSFLKTIVMLFHFYTKKLDSTMCGNTSYHSGKK